MKPNKAGQVAKFHTPFEDEDPNQLYVVLEIKGDDDTARVDIKPLNTGFSMVSIITVRLNDLEVVPVKTVDLIGYSATITKSDYSKISGKVIEVSEQEVMLDLNKGIEGVETNVSVTVRDVDGKLHEGYLFVNQFYVKNYFQA